MNSTKPGPVEPARGGRGLWSYAVDLYGRPGVAPACLALQDRFGLDVNLLLAACYRAARGRGPIARADLRRLAPRLGRWQGQVVAPLRQARRALRTPPGQPQDAAARLRRAIGRAELAAERIELRWLEAALARGRRHAAADPLADAALSLGRCCRPEGAGPLPRAARRHLRHLLAAAFPDATGGQIARALCAVE